MNTINVVIVPSNLCDLELVGFCFACVMKFGFWKKHLRAMEA